MADDCPFVAQLVVKSEHPLLEGEVPLLFGVGGVDVSDISN